MIDIATNHQFFRCPHCFNNELVSRAEGYHCSSCHQEFPIKDKRIFFHQTSSTNKPIIDHDSTNKNLWSRWRLANFHFFKKNLDAFDHQKTVIDLGAGPSQFGDLTHQFTNLIEVDIQPYQTTNVVADLTQTFPFRDAICDLIIISNTLEHISNPTLFLNECFRILRPGGAIIGTIPFLMRIHQKPYDYNRFTHYMLEKLLQQTGFQRIEIKSLGEARDVYQTMQYHFFCHLISSRFSANPPLHHCLKTIARCLWKLHQFSFWLFSPFYQLAEATPDYTQGYSIIAHKP